MSGDKDSSYSYDYDNISDVDIKNFRLNNKLKQLLLKKHTGGNLTSNDTDYYSVKRKLEEKYILNKADSEGTRDSADLGFASHIGSLEEALNKGKKALGFVNKISSGGSEIQNLAHENLKSESQYSFYEENIDETLKQLGSGRAQNFNNEHVGDDFLDNLINASNKYDDENVVDILPVSDGEKIVDILPVSDGEKIVNIIPSDDEKIVNIIPSDDEKIVHILPSSDNDEKNEENQSLSVDELAPNFASNTVDEGFLGQNSPQHILDNIANTQENEELALSNSEDVIESFLEGSGAGEKYHEGVEINAIISTAPLDNEIVALEKADNDIVNGKELESEYVAPLQESNIPQDKSEIPETAVSLQKYNLKYESDFEDEQPTSNSSFEQDSASTFTGTLFSSNPFEATNESAADADSKIRAILETVKKQKENEILLKKQREEEEKEIEMKRQLAEEQERKAKEEQLERELKAQQEAERQRELDETEMKKLEAILNEKQLAELEYNKKFGHIKSEIVEKEKLNEDVKSQIQSSEKILDEITEKVNQNFQRSQQIENERVELEKKAVELEEKISQEIQLKDNISIEILKEKLEDQKRYTSKLKEQLSNKPIGLEISEYDSADICSLKEQISAELARAKELEAQFDHVGVPGVNEDFLFRNEDGSNKDEAIEDKSSELKSIEDKSIEDGSNKYKSSEDGSNKDNSSEDESIERKSSEDGSHVPEEINEDGSHVPEHDHESELNDEIADFYQQEGIPEGQYLYTKVKQYMSSRGEKKDSSLLKKLQDSRAVYRDFVAKTKCCVKRKLSEVFTRSTADINDVNDVNNVNDINDINNVNDINDVNNVNDVNYINDHNGIKDVNDVTDIKDNTTHDTAFTPESQTEKALDEDDLEMIRETYTKRHKLNDSSYKITNVYARDVLKDDLNANPYLLRSTGSMSDASGENSGIRVITLVREKMVTNPTNEVIVISSSDDDGDDFDDEGDETGVVDRAENSE